MNVLKNFQFYATPGQTIAIVGASGCGKSTVISILRKSQIPILGVQHLKIIKLIQMNYEIERFYDLQQGSASIDSCNVKDWQLENMRSHMAIVKQEPALFNISIRDNIAIGAKGKEATQDQIEEAAKMANIHDFILSLPKGKKLSLAACC